MQNNKQRWVGLRELRENTARVLKEVKRGKTLTVFRRAEPLFRICPMKEENWEEVIDFTKIKKGGVEIEDILSRI